MTTNHTDMSHQMASNWKNANGTFLAGNSTNNHLELLEQISEYEQNTWGRTGICSICFMMGKLVFEYEDWTVLFSLGKLVCVCLCKPSEVHWYLAPPHGLILCHRWSYRSRSRCHRSLYTFMISRLEATWRGRLATSTCHRRLYTVISTLDTTSSCHSPGWPDPAAVAMSAPANHARRTRSEAGRFMSGTSLGCAFFPFRSASVSVASVEACFWWFGAPALPPPVGACLATDAACFMPPTGRSTCSSAHWVDWPGSLT